MSRLLFEELVAQPRIEALDVAVLPGEPRSMKAVQAPTVAIHCQRPRQRTPGRCRTGCKLELRARGTGRSRPHDTSRGKPPPHADRQALTGELVQYIARAEGPAVVGPVMDEVIGPDMARPLAPQLGAGAVVQSQTGPLQLTGRHPQPLAPPQALDPLVVDLPACLAQKGRNPPGAAAAVLPCQFRHVRHEGACVLTAARDIALSGAVLPQ